MHNDINRLEQNIIMHEQFLQGLKAFLKMLNVKLKIHLEPA